MLEKYTKFVISKCWAVIAACVLIAAVFGKGTIDLDFSSDYQAFFSDDNPQLVAFESVQKTYSRSDNLFIMIAPESGDVFDENTLSAILAITDKAWDIPYVTRVDSLSNFQYSYGVDDDLVVKDLFDTVQVDKADLRKIALNEPLLVNRLVSPNADATGVNITINLPGENPMFELPEVAEVARAIILEMENQYPSVQFYESGMIMLDNALAESTVIDLVTLVPLVYILVAVGVALFLRSVWLSVGTVILVTLSIVSAMGLAGWLGVVLTPPSASVPPIIMTLAVAHCLHILTTFLQKRKAGFVVNVAIVESVKLNFKPVILTTLTTALGFMSLNFSDVPPYRDLGNITAFGMMFAFFFSFTFLPALLAVLPSKAQSYNEIVSPRLIKLADVVIRRRASILVTGLTLIVVSLFLIPLNTLDDNFIEYFDDSIEFRTDTDKVTETLTGVYFIEYSLDSGVSDGINDPKFLNTVQEFSDWLYTQPEVVHVDSIVETIKRLNFNLHGNDSEYHSLPNNQSQIAQYLLLYELSLPNGLDLNSQINVSKSSTRLSVSLETLSTLEMLDFEERAIEWLEVNASELKVDGVSPTLIFSHISLRNIKSLLLGAGIALLLISVLLIFVFRSVKYGMLSMVSNVVPACIAFAIWGVTIGQVSVGVSVVIAMTLGIVVDDTIHLFSKYLDARRVQGKDPEAAIRYAFSTVGVALVGTTVILTVGFLIMAQSSYQVNSHMGTLSAVTIVIALLIDLLLIPPLILLLDKPNKSAS